ncbi:MAG: hypothetical protein MJ078_02855 [Clostridia bacterium]|nr:hypothetical protein [Clostridia bacterium]
MWQKRAKREQKSGCIPQTPLSGVKTGLKAPVRTGLKTPVRTGLKAPVRTGVRTGGQALRRNKTGKKEFFFAVLGFFFPLFGGVFFFLGRKNGNENALWAGKGALYCFFSAAGLLFLFGLVSAVVYAARWF